MIYKILQIDLRDKHDRINEVGWDGAIAEFPAVKAYLDTSLSGASSYTPDMLAHYRLAVIVYAPDLNACFALCNGSPVEDAWIVHADEPRSLSVGDIVVACTAEGETHYMVDPVGFTQIKTPREQVA